VPVPGVSDETIVATYDRLAGVYDRLVVPFEAGTRRRAWSPARDAGVSAPGSRTA
jgi:hypothetical protein